MEAELIAEGVGNLLMHSQIGSKLIQISLVFDALFKFAGEMGRDADRCDAGILQLHGNYQMLRRRSDGPGFINGQLEIHLMVGGLRDVVPAVDGMVDGFGEYEHNPLQFRFIQFADDGKCPVQIFAFIFLAQIGRQGGIGLLPFLRTVLCGLVIDVGGAVQCNHGAAAFQGVVNLIFGLEMVAIGTVAVAIAGLKDAEGCCCDDLRESAAGQVQFPDGLLRQDGEHIITGNGTQLAGGCQSQPIAQTQGEPAVLVAAGLRIGEQLHHDPGVFHTEGAEQHLAAAFAGKAGGFAGNCQLLVSGAADHGTQGLAGSSPGIRIHGVRAALGQCGIKLVPIHCLSGADCSAPPPLYVKNRRA